MKKQMIYLAMVCAPALVGAQVSNNTELVGTITDRTGGVLAGAVVTGTNTATKVQYIGKTNAEGYYSIPFVQPGTYDIVITQNGFEKTSVKGVVVTLNLAVRTDASLAVGSSADVVTVTAETPALSTDDALVGETLNASQVANLPLAGRRVLELAATDPSVIVGPKTSYTGTPPGADFIGAGTREVTNSLTLDGITIMNSLISNSPVTPIPDAVAAVQTQTGNYTAQYGAYMGVHINADTKSGTNQLHGTAYDYVQNDFFNAKSWTTASTARTPVLRFNQFGGEMGGPIFVPRLFNGRDRAFFMGSYEAIRQISQTSTTATLLTAAERNGDFSALCSAFSAAGLCTTGTQLYNPTTRVALVNNQVPVSPYASKFLTYYPTPNLTGTVNNYNEPVANLFNQNQTLDRVDYALSEKVRLFARFDYESINSVNGNVVATSASTSPTRNTNGMIGYTHIITPRFINDLRVGFNKLSTNNLNYFDVNGINGAGTALGITGFTADTTSGNPGIPTVAISNYTGLGAEGTNWFQGDRTVHGYDQVSYSRGRHDIMAGADIRRMTIGRSAGNQNRGQFTFNGTYTGNAASDFISGYAYQVITPVTQIKGSVAEWRDGFFVQDSWQAGQKLTVNYGLRYELPTVPYSLDGYARVLNASYTALIPTSSATSGSTYVPTPGFRFIGPNHDLVSPRLGFAYRPAQKIVVRGGGGIYFNPNHLNSFTLASSNYPFAASVTYTGATGTGAVGTLSFAQPTGGQAGTASPVAGTAGTYVSAFTDNPYLPTPRLYQWNLDTGVELWRNGALELQYLGSRAIDLDHSLYPNQPLPSTSTASVNSRRPYQLFGQIRQIQNDSFSTYHGFSAIMRQHSYHGLDMMLGYTWAHNLDTSSDANGGGTPMIQYDLKADYGNSNWDIRNRFVGTVTYALPELRGHNFAVRAAAGGWQANTIVTLQSGLPFNVGITNDQANVGGVGTQRPNFVHPGRSTCSRASRTIGGNATSCIDVTAYALPAYGTFGNLHRNDLHGPGYENVAFSMFKNFPIFERITAQVRAEAFNLFNHASPSNPAATLPSASSAGVFNFTGATFGTITSSQSTARVLQLAGKINF